MEFAVVTALMAVLAATAAPKFSDISESGKFRKSKSEMEKIAKQALNFYQDKACLLYTSPSPRDYAASRMPSSA